MGYYQTVFNFGEKNFIRECKRSKVAGVLLLTYHGLKIRIFQIVKKNNITFVQLISPTTTLKG